jgi:hypothetical protein
MQAAAQAQPAASPSKPSAACKLDSVEGLDGLKADDSTDVTATKDYQDAVAKLLTDEDFASLDCLADSSRLTKARFAGGMWKLHALYMGLARPQGHATEEDWAAHLGRLNRWAAKSPNSTAARVALAQAYEQYAWDARGGETSDTVSDSGWRLFGERLQKAQDALNDAAALPVRDPDWFSVQEEIAIDQDWEPVQFARLLKKAVGFEPGYYYYYRMYATYLLPKWHGEEGQMAKFAESSADTVGGDDGDIVYFQIAVNQICHCGDDEVALKSLSWPRIRKGFAAQQKRSGESLYNMNQLAFMSTVFQDPATGDKIFKQLGDRWSEEVWHTQTYYEQNKKSDAEIAPVIASRNANEQEAAENAKTAEGAQYQAAIQKQMNEILKTCAQAPGSDSTKLTMMFRIGQDGMMERMNMDPSSPMVSCLIRPLYEQQQVSKKAPFPKPPKASYWVKVVLDPAAVATGSEGR